MSLGTFLAKIWQSIARLFAKLPSATKAAVEVGYVAVNTIKEITDLDSGNLIGSIFGQFGAAVEQKIRAGLPNVLIQLQLVKDAADLNDPDAIVKMALETIQKIAPQFQAAFYHDLSIYIAQLAADGNLSWEDGVHILQWYHDHQKIAPAAEDGGGE